MSTITKDLGVVTAYGYAVSKGYEGTEEEFAELMASYATVAEQAAQSAQTATEKAQAAAQAVLDAVAAKDAAVQAKNDAETAKTSAQQFATSAGNSASSASGSATNASQSAQAASDSASAAAQSATNASGSATAANIAKEAAVSAKGAAETAQGKAETAQSKAEEAQGKAEEAADDLSAEVEQIETNKNDIANLKSDLNDTADWLGYALNVFDANLFTTTNTTNWTLTKTRDSITIVHNNTFSTGSPRTGFLNLPIGVYTFNANYAGSENEFGLYDTNGYVKILSDGTKIEVTEANQYYILFYSTVQATYTITDIAIRKESYGKIQEINDSVEDLTAEVASADKKITELESGFYDIADDVVEEITGTETVNKAIASSGSIVSAGSNNYKIISYDVTEKKKYWVSGSANWGNLEWAFYDSNENLVEKGTATESGSAFTTFSDVEVETPVGATVLIVSCNVTSLEGKCKTQTGFSPKKKWNGIKWVCVGDSLTAENIRTTKHYFDYVSEKTGISIVNMGVSGSGYARMADTSQAFYQRISSCPTDADVVTIFGSFNDLGAGLSIGSVDDTETDTLAGCINTTITNLQAVIPLVNLGIVAPTPWDTTQPSDSGQAYNYVNMLKKICEHRSIPFLDLWRCSNLRPWDADFRTLAYSKDGGSGTHPDENGHKLIAPRFLGFLDTLLL